MPLQIKDETYSAMVFRHDGIGRKRCKQFTQLTNIVGAAWPWETSWITLTRPIARPSSRSLRRRRQWRQHLYTEEQDTTFLITSGMFLTDFCNLFVLVQANRNSFLQDRGVQVPTATSTGTTIVGCVFKDGIVLGADTRATGGPIVADKNCEKVRRFHL